MMELLNEFLSGSVAWGVLLTLACLCTGSPCEQSDRKGIF